MTGAYKFTFLMYMAVLLMLGTVCPSSMLGLYNTWWYEILFDHPMKCLINMHSHRERSLWRNLVFNLDRCLFNETFCYFFFGQTLPLADIIIRVVSIAAITVVV